MIKRLLITATALITAVGFVGSTVAAPMADAPAATPSSSPAKKKTTKKKTTSTKKKAPAKKTTPTPAPKS